jgi:hypothetical protein
LNDKFFWIQLRTVFHSAHSNAWCVPADEGMARLLTPTESVYPTQ